MDEETPLTGPALVKEVCRLIREARSQWDAHNNAACRRVRGRALRLYGTLTPEQKDQVPQVLRVWLRYRSEKYFGARKKAKKKKPRPGA
ncbi:MAG: Precorrin-3B methylase [Armatimonadota bacterium]